MLKVLICLVETGIIPIFVVLKNTKIKKTEYIKNTQFSLFSRLFVEILT